MLHKMISDSVYLPLFQTMELFLKSLYEHVWLCGLDFWGGEAELLGSWVLRRADGALGVNDKTNDCSHLGGFQGMIEPASVCSSWVEGFVWCPSSWAKQGTLSTAPIPAVVNHLPPPSPQSHSLSFSLSFSCTDLQVQINQSMGALMKFCCYCSQF